MLLKFYAMSVWFAGKKSELYLKGMAFLFGNFLFFIAVAIAVFLISLLPFKINVYILLALLLLLGYMVFYGYIKHWILEKVKKEKIANKYRTSSEQIKKREAYLGLLLFILSFTLMNFSFYINFQGYLTR